MKTLLATLAAATILGVPSGRAQVMATDVVANVPFDFQVGENTFSAGKCRIAPAGRPDTMTVRCESGERALIFVTESQRGTEGPGALRFERIGGRFYLTEVYASGRTHGSQIGLSRLAKEQMAAERTPAGVVEIAAR
jgi:hypothetical protein